MGCFETDAFLVWRRDDDDDYDDAFVRFENNHDFF